LTIRWAWKGIQVARIRPILGEPGQTFAARKEVVGRVHSIYPQIGDIQGGGDENLGTGPLECSAVADAKDVPMRVSAVSDWRGAGKMEKNVFGCFLLGAGVGVGIALLVAPQTGKQIRGRVKAKADEGKEYLKQRGAALRDSAADLVGKGKQASTERRLDAEALQRMDGEGAPASVIV
jgi:gas vesicle protein